MKLGMQASWDPWPEEEKTVQKWPKMNKTKIQFLYISSWGGFPLPDQTEAHGNSHRCWEQFLRDSGSPRRSRVRSLGTDRTRPRSSLGGTRTRTPGTPCLHCTALLCSAKTKRNTMKWNCFSAQTKQKNQSSESWMTREGKPSNQRFKDSRCASCTQNKPLKEARTFENLRHAPSPRRQFLCPREKKYGTKS